MKMRTAYTRKVSHTFLILVVGFSFALSAHAQTASESEYYTLDESQASSDPGQMSEDPARDAVNPLRLKTLSLDEFVSEVRTVALSLLRWTLHPQAPVLPNERYNRRLHFGRWINDSKDQTCYNTRAKVLMRDTEGPVSYKETNRCIVDKGTWEDPYSGRTFTESRDIQIDHMVPLKNAYVSGAWEWNYQTRCLYANFLGNNFHLIASNGTENMRKGDSAPDQYIPPNPAYRCQYLENWLKIKMIWKLKMTPNEVTSIKQGIRDNNCDAQNFSLNKKDLREQRDYIQSNLGLCPAR